jgi:hypothetical protein
MSGIKSNSNVSSNIKIKYKRILPSNLIIDSAGSHLYRSGLGIASFDRRNLIARNLIAAV